MKKFFTAALIALTFVTSAFASTREKINNKVAAHLEATYPAAKNVSWTYTDNFEKASITVNNENIDVFYDAYGELVGSSKTMAFDRLPKSALEVLTTDYTFPDYQLTDCIEFTDAYNTKRYYVSFEQDNERIMLSISANGFVSRM